MEIEKIILGGTSVWASILLEQFQNSTRFKVEPEKCLSPFHIGSSIPTFRDMYYYLIMQRKTAFIIFCIKFTVYIYMYIYIYIYIYIKHKTTGIKISLSFFFFHNSLTVKLDVEMLWPVFPVRNFC